VRNSALNRPHSQPELAGPMLIKNLNRTNADVSNTIMALGQFGEQAKPAVPALLELLNDPDEIVRSLATYNLKQIDPETAAKVGVH
jgi:HEAT repeat protein